MKTNVGHGNVTASVKFGAPDNEEFQHSTGYTVTLRYQRRQLTVPFYMGLAHTDEPDAETVLECLLSDASGMENARTFEEWCDEYGYDTDSRKAERIYKATERNTDKLRHLLGSDYDTFLWNSTE